MGQYHLLAPSINVVQFEAGGVWQRHEAEAAEGGRAPGLFQEGIVHGEVGVVEAEDGNGCLKAKIVMREKKEEIDKRNGQKNFKK